MVIWRTIERRRGNVHAGSDGYPLNSFVQVDVDVEVQVANGDWRFSLAEPSCLATAQAPVHDVTHDRRARPLRRSVPA